MTRLCPHCKQPLTYSKGFELWLCRKCDLAPCPPALKESA